MSEFFSMAWFYKNKQNLRPTSWDGDGQESEAEQPRDLG